MQKNKRNFIIFNKHQRLKRLWQFFFTGWGLVMIVALVAGAMFTQELLWSPISAINMADVVTNQFKMSNASFAGIDNKGQPFKISANTGRQEYDTPDIIFLDGVSGTVNRETNRKMITDNITAQHGKYDRTTRQITLYGNVKVLSSNGDKIFTKELVIQL